VSRVLAIAGRELRAYFLSPAGYVITALFLTWVGLAFIAYSFHQGRPSSMRAVFELGTWVLLFICPAISMRAIAEERRMGTFEMIMTCPVSDAQLVLGKYLAAIGFLIIMFLPTVLHVAVLEWYGRPDYGELASGYLGMLLAGSVYVASTILASTLTSSQVVAFLVPLFFWLAVGLGMKELQSRAPEPWQSAAFAADPDLRLRDFAIGLIDTANIVYFLTITAALLMAAVQSLGMRRWR
jgi:ABC-2 type transport system permease protein